MTEIRHTPLITIQRIRFLFRCEVIVVLFVIEMLCCGASPLSEEEEERRRVQKKLNKDINAEIGRDKKDYRATHRVLLLGRYFIILLNRNGFFWSVNWHTGCRETFGKCH